MENDSSRTFPTYFFLLLCIVTIIYGALIYSIISCQYNFDFTSFYSSTFASIHGDNPYYTWIADYLPTNKPILINLNPPIFLLFIYPLVYLSYPVALKLWMLLIFVLGLTGAWVAFYYAFSLRFIKLYWHILYFFYLILFSSLVCFSAAQVGTFLLFFLMLGYHFYLKNNDYAAGILWGFIISLKLFPALLILFVLKQGRMKTLTIMLITIGVCFLLPLLIWGPIIYYQYTHTMMNISWYDNNWNASVLGFISRTLNELQCESWIKPVYSLIFVISLIGYLLAMGKKTRSSQVNHQPFCLTLVMMLLLSPLGWVYYFPLLFFPLLLMGAAVMKETNTFSFAQKSFCLSFFFINYPIKNSEMLISKVIDRVGFSSFYFMGLLILTVLLINHRHKLTGDNHLNYQEEKNTFILILVILTVFGAIIPSTGYLMRLSVACVG